MDLLRAAAGLTPEEIRRRRFEFCPNQIERIRQRPLYLRLVESFTQLFAILLWFVAAIASLAKFFQPAAGMAKLGYAIVGVIVINGLSRSGKNSRCIAPVRPRNKAGEAAPPEEAP